MNTGHVLIRLLVASIIVLTLLPFGSNSLISQANPPPSEFNSDTFLSYLPILLRNYFDTGPHFPLAYGPYRTGQAPGGPDPSPAEIEQDMEIIEQETKLIRTYGACGVLGTIPPIARQHNIRLYQGVYLSSNLASNANEMGCYSTLLTGNPNIIAGIIGNETLLRGDLSEAALIGYIDQAKQMGDVSASTAETWNVWCSLNPQNPRCPGRPLLSGSAEFITLHVHPYWESVSIEHGAAYVLAIYIALRATYPYKHIIVGETGWPTCGNTRGAAVPSIANQRRFIEELWRASKLYNVPVVYFEAFDEPWKVAQEGQVGGCWGMYYVNRTPKHTTLDWSIPVPSPAPASPAVHIEHPQGITSTVTDSDCSIPIYGRVYHAEPGWHVKVEVYTNQWYLQDKWYLNGLAPIIDSMWSMPEIVLAGQSQFNNHSVRATLVDEMGTPIAVDEVSGIIRTNTCTP